MADKRGVPLEIMRPLHSRGRGDADADAGKSAAGAAEPSGPGGPAGSGAAGSGGVEAGHGSERGGGRAGGSWGSGGYGGSGGSRGSGGSGVEGSGVSTGWGTRVRHWFDAERGSPLLLRVPRGIAVVVVSGVLGLIVLGYQVGYRMGASATAARLAEAGSGTESGVGAGSGSMPGAEAGSAVGSTPGAGVDWRHVADPSRGRVFTPAQADPRRVGLNYLMVARYPESEARALAEFLAGRGVDVAVIPSDNAELFFVAALPGYARGEGDAMDAMRSRMMALGRAWKQHNQGRGDDLRSMYFDKHEGPPD